MPDYSSMIRSTNPLGRRTAIAMVIGCLATASRSHSASAAEAGKLRIGGTGMALATMRQIGEAFAANTPGAEVQVLPSLGTGGGLSAVAAGAIELALSARALNDAERAKGLHSLAYARTPIAFVTHPDTGVDAVTLDEVADILTGRMMKWPSGAAVRLIRREPSDADWTMFRSLSSTMAEAVRVALERPGLVTVATDQDNADALERLRGSFGAMSLGQMRAESRRVTPLSLDRRQATIEALASGQYPLSRTLYVVWRDQPAANVSEFLTFLRSDPASDTLRRLGHIAVGVEGM